MRGMPYGDYLRDRSSQCIRLAVEQPWSDETGALIDLARDYSTLACGFDEKEHAGEEVDVPGAGLRRFFN